MPSHRDVVTRYSELRPDDVVSPHGVVTTTAVRSAFDLARGRCLDDAVVAVDALMQSCRITRDAIAAYADDGRWRWHGVRRLGLNALRALGWTLLRFTADDVLRRSSRMVAQVGAAAGLPYLGYLNGVS